MKKLLKFGAYSLMTAALLTSCKSKETSDTTGWNYNDKDWGGFEKLDYEGQATGPNLVLVEGGTFTMGYTQDDVMAEWNNIPRRVTVSSFYMDETEVSNIAYREYVYWLSRTFTESNPEVVEKARPDSLVWLEEMSFNDAFVKGYFTHPSYDNYPVIGVNWLQANDYARWRTDRVNEMILIQKGIINPNPEQKGEENFNTDAYLAGKYEPNVRRGLKDVNTGDERAVRFEDGILLPEYRLPTEAEWEYAALALRGNQSSDQDELYTDRRNYPWNGNSVRYQVRDKNQGAILANFKKGKGDYMGVAGKLNDNAHIPGEVRSYMPNDFGLYNMAGNVSEWVLDAYRPLTATTLRDAENQDLNPYRGDGFKVPVKDNNGEVQKDSLGRIKYRLLTAKELENRSNVRKGELIGFQDGDSESGVTYDAQGSLISDKSRVYKGGSWADRAYWLSPGARRFKDEDEADRTIGFRCAMTRMGSPTSNEQPSGNVFNVKNKRVDRRFK